MNKLALGTVQFGMRYGINKNNIFKQSEISEILKIAQLNKINTLDTAIAYGNSQLRLGREDIKNFNVISKIPKILIEKDIDKWVEKSIDESLKKLNKNQLYGILIHDIEDLNKNYSDLLYKTLIKLKEEKKVKKIGVSIYSPSDLDHIVNNFDIDIVQSPFSIFDRRLDSSGWMKRLTDRNIEIHVRSIFLQGLLLMNFNEIPKKFKNWSNLFKQWDRETSKTGICKIGACLQFVLSQDSISKVIFGIDNISQLNEIINKSNLTTKYKLSDFSCEDESLLNPSMWKNL